MSEDRVQGEGNYKAEREFNDAERRVVASVGKVAAGTRAAVPESEAELQQMFAAEEEGKRRATGEDSGATKAGHDPAAPGVRGNDGDRKHR
jgi:hypothetical protein